MPQCWHLSCFAARMRRTSVIVSAPLATRALPWGKTTAACPFRNQTALTKRCDLMAHPVAGVCSSTAGCLAGSVCQAACCDHGGPNTGPNLLTINVTQFSEYAVVNVPCTDTPLAGCTLPFVSAKSQWQIKDKSVDKADGFKWKWQKGSATTLAHYGSPTTDPGTDYAVCVYAGASPALVGHGTLRAGGTCGTSTNPKPCWKAVSSVGFNYKSKSRYPDGMDDTKLRVGENGKASIQVGGKGVDLLTPVLPLSLPVRVQLQGTNGKGWESVHSTATMNVGPSGAAPGMFKSKAN